MFYLERKKSLRREKCEMARSKCEIKALRRTIKINCDGPSQIKEGIGNGPRVMKDVTEKWIHVPKEKIELSAPPEPPRTTQ